MSKREVDRIKAEMCKLSRVPGFLKAIRGENTTQQAQDAKEKHFNLWLSLPAQER